MLSLGTKPLPTPRKKNVRTKLAIAVLQHKRTTSAASALRLINPRSKLKPRQLRQRDLTRARCCWESGVVFACRRCLPLKQMSSRRVGCPYHRHESAIRRSFVQEASFLNQRISWKTAESSTSRRVPTYVCVCVCRDVPRSPHRLPRWCCISAVF